MFVKKNVYITMLFMSLLLFCITSCEEKTEEVMTSSEVVEEISVESVEESVAEESVYIEEKSVDDYQKEALPPPKAAVDESYFDDAVFIGDSRTQGFIYYNGLVNAISYVDKGLNVDTALNKQVIKLNDSYYTVPEALKAGKSFKKVYIMLGINELGWVYSDIFIEKYSMLIDKIKEVNPDAVIYVQSILPVTEEKSNSDEIYNMEKINGYNTLIKAMAEEKGLKFLNVSESVADENGFLPKEAASDGIHLKKSYCALWLEYLKNNVV